MLLYEKGKEVTRVPTKTATADFTARNYFTRVRRDGARRRGVGGGACGCHVIPTYGVATGLLTTSAS